MLRARVPPFDYAAAVDGTMDTTSEGDNSYQVNGMLNTPLVVLQSERFAFSSILGLRHRSAITNAVESINQHFLED